MELVLDLRSLERARLPVGKVATTSSKTLARHKVVKAKVRVKVNHPPQSPSISILPTMVQCMELSMECHHLPTILHLLVPMVLPVSNLVLDLMLLMLAIIRAMPIPDSTHKLVKDLMMVRAMDKTTVEASTVLVVLTHLRLV
jgi:hypothetical protein